jgi:hypothetical protein
MKRMMVRQKDRKPEDRKIERQKDRKTKTHEVKIFFFFWAEEHKNDRA